VGEIDEYTDIKIEWKRGKHAVLTIYDDEGKEIEDIKLYELKTRAEMHQLLFDKGFAKKTQSEKAQERQVATREKQLRAIELPSTVHDRFTTFYFIIAVLIVGEYSIVYYRKNRKIYVYIYICI
jgi:hypothetical protein